MTRGKGRRLVAAAALLACLVALPGPAGAADPPSLSIDDQAVLEGSGGTTTIVFTVTRTGDLAAESRVTVSTSPSDPLSAIAPDDYASKTAELTFAADEGTKTFAVDVAADGVDEFNETFRVALSGADAATITKSTGTATITDDDDPPSVSTFADAEVTEDAVTLNLKVVLSGKSGKTITIDYGPGEGGTATPGDDFTAPSGRLTFEPGVQERNLPITIKEDALAEADETLFVNLFAHTNVETGGVANTQAKVTIKDDGDAAAKPTITSPSIFEGTSGTVELTFEASLPAPHPATTFNFRTAAGSADGSDFEAQSGSKNFPANSSTAAGAVTKVPITIKVKGDVLDELDETFKVELLTTGTTEDKVAEGTGTIKNDDNNSKLSISDATADEPGTMKFTVSLAPASGREVNVNWATADGTATAPGDYTAGSGQLTFAPGEPTKTIEIAIAGDSTNEENETLKVNLSGPTGVPLANLVDAVGDGTIVDKNAPPSLSISDTTTREGVGADFVVTLAGTTLRTVTVRFNTADGTAQAGSDYSARVGSLTFAPGEKTKTISVTVFDDGAAEFIENFSVSLGDPVNATITKSRGVAIIEASDQPASLQGSSPPTTTPRTTQPASRTSPNVPKTQLVPRMILGPRTVMVGVNGLAKMQVNCQKVSPIVCAGTVELERAAKPLLKLGKKTFSVKKGTKAFASIKLSARALSILRKSKTMRVKVTVLVKTNTKTVKASPGTITLQATTGLMKSKPKPPPTKVVVDP